MLIYNTKKKIVKTSSMLPHLPTLISTRNCTYFEAMETVNFNIVFTVKETAA